MTNRNDYYRQLMEEFRANGGKVSGTFEHTPLLLLTTTGARSGERLAFGFLPRPASQAKSPFEEEATLLQINCVLL